MNERYCQIHQGYCEGPTTTRRSVFGAIITACEVAWTEPMEVEQDLMTGEKKRLPVIDLRIWPEVLNA